MDVSNEPAPEGKGEGKPGGVSLEEQNRGLMQGMMAEREKRHALERQVSELKGKMDALQKTASEPKQYSRQELSALVEDGKLDQGQADQIMENQLRAKVTREATDAAVSAVNANSRNDRISAEIGRYKDAVPDVLSDGSAARQRVEQEFQYLVSLGDSPDAATELKALRAVYGPVDRLQKGEPGRETHQETGGEDPDAGGDDDSMRTDGMPKGLTAAQRAYYKPLIGRLYKDWGEVQAELKYANPRLVKKHAAL